jgi:hypothetical protein
MRRLRQYGVLVGFVALLALSITAGIIYMHSRPAAALAVVNKMINYSGRLLDNNGNVVPDGTYNMRFKIYQDGSGTAVGDPGGTQVWTEKYQVSNSQGITVKNGYFTVNLGSICSLDGGTTCQAIVNPGINYNQSVLWMSVDIGGTSSAASPTYDGEMLPMKALTASAYAMNTYELNGLTSSQIVQIAPGGVQVDSTTNNSIFVNKTGASGNIIELQRAGADVFNINNAGQATFQPQTDSQTALQVQNAAGTVTTFTVDSINARIGVGLSTPNYAVDVVGSINASATLRVGAVDVCSSSAGCTPGPGGSNYIQNQSASPQTANFKITSTSTTATTATLQVTNTQTSDLLDVRNASGNIIAGFQNSGSIFAAPAGTTIPSNARLFVQPLGSATIAIIGRAAANGTPTGDLMDLQDQTGSATLLSVAATGATVIKPNAAGNAFQVQNASGTNVLTVNTSTSRVTIGSITNANLPAGQLYVAGIIPSNALSSVTTGTSPNGVVVVGNYAYVVNRASNTLQVIDVSVPASPVMVSTTATGGTDAQDIAVAGHYAYIVNFTSETLQVFDIGNAAAPTSVATVSTNAANGNDNAIVVQGHYAYIITKKLGVGAAGHLLIYDIANPAAPALLSNTTTVNARATNLAVQGNYVYTVTDSGGSSPTTNSVEVYDATIPTSPSLASNFGLTTGSAPQAIAVQGRYVYVLGGGTNSLYILDAKNPTSMLSAGSTSVGTGVAPQDLFIQGHYLYLVGSGTSVMQVYDITTPTTAFTVGSVSTNSGPWSLYIQGRYAYVVNAGPTNNGTTMQIFDIGGAYVQTLATGGLSTGTITANNNSTIQGNVISNGNVNIGQGLLLSGNLSVTGDVAITTPSNSTQSFQILDSSSNVLLKVDSASTPQAVKIGGGDTSVNDTPAFLQLDNKTSSADPTGIEGAMYYNGATRSFRCYGDGTWRSCVSGVVFANTSIPAGNTVTATASDTAFTSTYSVPGNDCQAGRVYKITASGIFTTPNTTVTLIMRLNFGGNTLAAKNNQNPTIQGTSAGTATAVTNVPWTLNAQVICDSTTTMDALGWINFTAATAPPALSGTFLGTITSLSNPPAINNDVGPVTVTTTSTQTLGLTAKWSATSCSITLRQFIVEASGP